MFMADGTWVPTPSLPTGYRPAIVENRRLVAPASRSMPEDAPTIESRTRQCTMCARGGKYWGDGGKVRPPRRTHGEARLVKTSGLSPTWVFACPVCDRLP